MTQQVFTLKELKKAVNKKSTLKHIGYRLFVHPFMPTDEKMGFQGCAIARVSRKEFLRVATDLLENLEKRGAKLNVTIPGRDYESWII